MDCLSQGHMLACWQDAAGRRGSSCMWCPTAAHDADMDVTSPNLVGLRLKQDWANDPNGEKVWDE